MIRIVFVIIIAFFSNNIYSQINIDSNWEVGSNWNVDVTIYPKYKGRLHTPRGLGVKPWREEWDSVKIIPIINYTGHVNIIDTAKYLENKCWLFAFSADTSGKDNFINPLESYRARTIKDSAFLWIDQESLEVRKGDGGTYQKMRTSKFDSYQLPNIPGHTCFPSFISLLVIKDSLQKDTLTVFRDPSVGKSTFRYIEQKMEVTEDGYIFYTKYVKNPGRKQGELRSEGYFDREVIICWEKGKSWWSSYKLYVDGELEMEAYLIEED